MIPVVEVVATILPAGFLPSKGSRVSLVVDHDALLEGGVVVFAAVAAVHGDLHGVKLVLSVLFGHEHVVRLADVVVEKRHVLIKSNR